MKELLLNIWIHPPCHRNIRSNLDNMVEKEIAKTSRDGLLERLSTHSTENKIEKRLEFSEQETAERAGHKGGYDGNQTGYNSEDTIFHGQHSF